MFYIYMRETVNILFTINKRNKSNAGFAMFVTGLVVFYVLGVIIQQALAMEGGNFMQKLLVFFFAGLTVAGIVYTYFTVLNKTYFRYIQSSSDSAVAETTTADVMKDRINNTMNFILNLGKELFFTSGKLVVGMLCVFACLFVLFFIYDKLKKGTYKDYVDKKRKVFQSVCYVVYSILVGLYM
jgi:small-conductance mechanosensitive channel